MEVLLGVITLILVGAFWRYALRGAAVITGLTGILAIVALLLLGGASLLKSHSPAAEVRATDNNASRADSDYDPFDPSSRVNPVSPRSPISKTGCVTGADIATKPECSVRLSK